MKIVIIWIFSSYEEWLHRFRDGFSNPGSDGAVGFSIPHLVEHLVLRAPLTAYPGEIQSPRSEIIKGNPVTKIAIV